MEQHNIPTAEVKLINLQPDAILAAWSQERIDAAFVWSPILNQITKSGTVLLNSGSLADSGKPTFDGMIVRREFAKSNRDFLNTFVAEIGRLDADYRQHRENWTAESQQVKAIAELTGADPQEIPTVLAQYHFPTPEEQAGPDWLGGGAANALRDTALFLLEQKKISAVHEDYSDFVDASFVLAGQEAAANPQ